MRKNWIPYESAARTLIDATREALGIAKPAGEVQGVGGVQWEFDARTWLEGSDGFLVVEVRRYASPLKQEGRALCAWRLRDIDGTLVASPCPQPDGGVPKAAAVEQLLLTDDSTAGNYLAEFLSRRFPVSKPAAGA